MGLVELFAATMAVDDRSYLHDSMSCIDHKDDQVTNILYIQLFSLFLTTEGQAAPE